MCRPRVSTSGGQSVGRVVVTVVVVLVVVVGAGLLPAEAAAARRSVRELQVRQLGGVSGVGVVEWVVVLTVCRRGRG